jgi:hypothetical protein
VVENVVSHDHWPASTSAEDALPAPAANPLRERALRSVPFASAAVAFAAYAATAARTITWWDGSSYPLAAVTLGIPGAPGSLLLTLLGWVVSRIPIVYPVAFRLNLFAALLGAILVGVLSWLGARLATEEGRRPGLGERVAGSLAGLTFAFAITPWTYATQFTPYVLSALWTALLLAATLAWWRRSETDGGRARLFLLFLLFGLDLSVHRTNSLLLPAALVWFALRRPALRRLPGDGAAAAAGFALGLAFHLLLIPMAAARPSYMVEDPGTWAGWWSYVTLEQKGGGFLFRLFPRTAGLLSVQVPDYLAFLRRNLSPAFFLPALLAVSGWILVLRRHPRRALGLLVFFLCDGPGAVLYFNLPSHYMRSIDRHYLPSLVILAPWMAVGAAEALRRAAHPRGRAVLVPAVAAVLALAPLAAWVAHHRPCDLSRFRFAETWSRDLLEPLPQDAILLTNGDNDTLPLWYMQQVEGVRRDVRVINLPLTNTGPFVTQLRRADPDLAHLLGDGSLPVILEPKMAEADSVTIVVEPRDGLGLPAGVAPPDHVRLGPTGMQFGQDLVALDILRLTRWRRPLFIACTVAPDRLPWLWPFARLDGLAFRVVPSSDPAVHDVDHLREQLLEHTSYAGVADTAFEMDEATRMMSRNYVASLAQLAFAQHRLGRPAEAIATLRFLELKAPPARLGMDDRGFAQLRAQCEAEVARAH